jgi:hypothetical protein
MQWPRCLRYESASARILGLRVRIPPRYGRLSLVSFVCRQVEVSATGRWLVQRTIVCGVWVCECDRRTSTMRRLRPTGDFELYKICTYIITSFQDSVKIRGPVKNYKTCFLRPDGFNPPQKSQEKGPPFFSCLLLFIEYIRSYLPKLDLDFSLRNLMMRHAYVTGTHSPLGGIVWIRWWINDSKFSGNLA